MTKPRTYDPLDGKTAEEIRELEEATLPVKQALFVRYYAFFRNGRRAAEAAGYVGDANTLMVQSARLLRDARVCAQIRALLKDWNDDLGLDPVYLRARLKCYLDVSIKQFYGPSGRPLHPSQWTEEMALCVKRVIHDDDGRIRSVELHDALTVAKMAMDDLGMGRGAGQTADDPIHVAIRDDKERAALRAIARGRLSDGSAGA